MEPGTLILSLPIMIVLNVVVEPVSTVAPQLQINTAILVTGIGTTQQAVDLTTMKTLKQMKCAALAKVTGQIMTGVMVLQTHTVMAAHTTVNILVVVDLTTLMTS